MEINKIYQGDCIKVMKGFDENSIDSIVTDPPYELGFMGKKWDQSGIAYNVEVWIQCLRILNPGGHLLSFGGTRTYHRMVCAIEDAGFEIRDTLQWIYGSGFPKSLDVSKAIDKMAGVERKVIGKRTDGRYKYGFSEQAKKAMGNEVYKHTQGFKGEIGNITVPVTPEAEQWDEFGTGLKPACEMICLARKPISEKTIAENILKWGTGGLNIEGCRIEYQSKNDMKIRKNLHREKNIIDGKVFGGGKYSQPVKSGRFPSNVILDEEAARMLDEKSGVLTSGAMRKAYKYTNTGYSLGDPSGETKDIHEANRGGASRFFYIAKASRSEREDGLEGFEYEQTDDSRKEGNPGGDNPRNRGVKRVKNIHPTVKPIKLMRYLVRLVTPPKGICADPFAGSGTTVIGCIYEDFGYIAIEKVKRYFNIMEKRVFHYKQQGKLF